MILKQEEKDRIKKLVEDILKDAVFAGEPIGKHYVVGLIETVEETIEKHMVPLPQQRWIKKLPPDQQGAAMANSLTEMIEDDLEDWFKSEGSVLKIFDGKLIPPSCLASLTEAAGRAIEDQMVPLPQRRFIKKLPPENRQSATIQWLCEYIQGAIASWFETEGVVNEVQDQKPEPTPF